MIESSTKIYEFWDGDFTFHTPVHPGDRRHGPFRVRIDNTPEQRALENVKNPNGMEPNWNEIAPATMAEAAAWLDHFREHFPQRKKDETTILRQLRLHGPMGEATLGWSSSQDMMLALRSLQWKRPVVRDFYPKDTLFVQEESGIYSLTDDGMWLTGLMK